MLLENESPPGKFGVAVVIPSGAYVMQESSVVDDENSFSM